MKFRPCIDIHNGKVKQIVGGSLNDGKGQAKENFVASMDAADYARLYQQYQLTGGHIILLNAKDNPNYVETKQQAISALKVYPGGLQIGGGINCDNAKEYINQGASHVIVTSYVFKNGEVSYENLKKMMKTVGRKHLVLDLSCKKKEDGYYIVTDRWQKDTNVKIDFHLLNEFKEYCDEFLIHAVDVEGKMNGIEQELVDILGKWGEIPITYAGGIHNQKDIDLIKTLGKEKIDFTVGSALDIFGGTLAFEKLAEYK